MAAAISDLLRQVASDEKFVIVLDKLSCTGCKETITDCNVANTTIIQPMAEQNTSLIEQVEETTSNHLPPAEPDTSVIEGESCAKKQRVAPITPCDFYQRLMYVCLFSYIMRLMYLCNNIFCFSCEN